MLPLLQLAQELYGQAAGVGERFCLEVVRATDGLAHLHLRQQFQDRESQEKDRMVCPSAITVCLKLPVQYEGIDYGELHVMAEPSHPSRPAIPFEICFTLVTICGWLLQVLEEGAILHLQRRCLVGAPLGRLSRRQRAVLQLMAQGEERETIAAELGITPKTVDSHRQAIYEILGVHSPIDAVLVAHRVGLICCIAQPLATP